MKSGIRVWRINGKSPPRRFDFVIFTATELEKTAVLKIFPFKSETIESAPNRGISRDYRWGYIDSASVAVVCAHGTGVKVALSVTNWIIAALAPDHLLVVGHGAGISRKENDKIKRRAVFLSTGVVRSASTKTVGSKKAPEATATAKISSQNPLKEAQVIPPSKKLERLASDITHFNMWKGKVISDEEEVITVDEVAANPADPTFRAIIDMYSRIALWDMEAGAVAEALTTAYQNFQRIPEYFIIKGFSDVHEMWRSEEEADVERNQEERARERRGASENAARFALGLIKRFAQRKLSRRISPLHRMMPSSVANIPVNDCVAGVLHKVQPADYSQIAEFNFKRCIDEKNGPKTIFTVCAFEPEKLWDILEVSFRQHNSKTTVEVDDLYNWAEKKFPHFKMFSRHAQEQRGSCDRILLLEDDRWPARLKPEHWKLFWKLNGNVKCWGAIRDHLQSEVPFLTDYCVIGDSLVLDYYADSETLLLSDVTNDTLKSVVLKLREVFGTQRQRFIPSSRLKKVANYLLSPTTPPGAGSI
jgi:nucleoside phosphorylase